MFAQDWKDNSERGSITVFFVLFVMVAAAAASYALYIGRSTEEKIRTDSAADLAALAMAQHSAMGLNMIAANNLAIGGNLHVGASVPFIGRYFALIEAMLVKFPDDLPLLVKLGKGGETADKTVFGDGFKDTKIVTGHFIRTAAGLTSINAQVAKHWLTGAMVKGVEQLRLNMPGDVGLMFQASSADGMATAASFYNMHYDSLNQSTPRQTMCQTIKSSQGLSHRDSVAFWVGGAIDSVVDTHGVMGALADVESLFQGLGSILSSNAETTSNKAVEHVHEITGGLDCGDDFSDLMRDVREDANNTCQQIDDLAKAKGGGGFLPSFSGCGLAKSGDFGQQFEKFGEAESSSKHEIGFIFPVVSKSTLGRYEQSLQFAAAVGNPMYLFEEMGKKSGSAISKSTTCPADWSVSVNGHNYCSVMLDGIDFNYASHGVDPSDRDLISGGVGRAVGENGGQHGKLRDVWSRVQWSLGQAKAEYEPGDGDPGEANALTEPAFKNGDTRANKRRMQYFWPAWKARSAEPSVLENVLKLLGHV